MSGGFDVGSIVGHLVLDKNQWTQAVNSVKSDQAALKKSFSSLSEDLRDVGRGLALAGAAVTGTFTLLIKGAVDAGDEINDLSKKTGISTELLSGYKLAADKSGTSLQGFAIGMKGLANQMQAAHDQGGAIKKTFDSIGVSFQDGAGKLRPLNQVLLDVADRFMKMPDGAAKSALAVDVFGKAGADLIPLLNLGRRGLEENYAAAEKLGLVYSKEAAEGADEFNDSLAELKGAVQGLGNEITQSLMPTLKPIVDDIKSVVVSVRQWAKDNPELAASLARTALGAGTLAAGIGAVCLALPSFLAGWAKLCPLLQAAGPYVAAIGAAWAGWNLGKQLGEITGLNKAIQDEIESGKGLVALYLKWAGYLREVNVEFGERHAAAAATRGAAIKRASEISGQAVKTIQEAVGILQEQFRTTGTTGDKVLDEWLKKFPDLRKSIANTGIGVGGLGGILSEFGIKTRSELTAELNKAESALKALKGTTEQTPGAVQALEEKIKSLREQLYGAPGKSFIEEFNIVLKDDLAARIDKIDQAIRRYGAGMPVSEVARLRKEQDELKDKLYGTEKAADDATWSLISYKGILNQLKGPEKTFAELEAECAAELERIAKKTKEPAQEIKKTETIWDTAIGTMMSTMVQFGDGTGSVLSAAGKAWTSFAETAIAASEMETVKLLMDSKLYIEAKKQETMASYIASLFKSFGIFALPMAAAAFAIINALFAKVMKFAHGGQFTEATLAVVGEGDDTEYALPEKKLVNIVRDAMSTGASGASGMTLAPAVAGGGRLGNRYAFNFQGPLIRTTGVSLRDLQGAGPALTRIVNRELRRNVRLRRR